MSEGPIPCLACRCGDCCNCEGVSWDDIIDDPILCPCDHGVQDVTFSVFINSSLKDGTIMFAHDGSRSSAFAVVVGTRPLTEVELAGATARHAVRKGLADVLEWLGQDVGDPPTGSGRGLEILAAARARFGNHADPT